MPSRPCLLVLHVPAGGGHRAAARAIAEAADARGVDAEVVDALELTPAWFAQAYVGAHLLSTERAPALYGEGYRAMNRRSAVRDGLRHAVDRAVGAKLRRFVVERRADAVIATHFYPLDVLGDARRAGDLGAPLVGVVTDYATHAFWAERGVDRFCTPLGRAARDLARHGVDPGAIVATGIPVRAAFGAIRARPLRAGDALRVLVTSGGFGIGPIADVIRSFAGIPRVSLTVVCGDNAARVRQARRAAAQAGVRAEIVGFEREMPRRVAEAHLLVGKPGGLTASEALAAGRPMVLVGACPGQETENQAFLVEHGAAIASEARLAGCAIAELRARGALDRMAHAARALGAPDAAARVVDVALRAAGRWADARRAA